jgi:hypothetical protein
VSEQDLSAVYAKAQKFTRFSGIFKLVIAGFLFVVPVLVGSALYLFVDAGLPGAMIFWFAGFVVAAVFGWRGYRDLTGEPSVLKGTIRRKEIQRSTGSTPGSRSVKHFLHMDVTEAFAVTPGGERRALGSRTGRRKVLSQFRLFDAVAEGDEVAVVCTPTGEAFARLDALS